MTIISVIKYTLLPVSTDEDGLGVCVVGIMERVAVELVAGIVP